MNVEPVAWTNKCHPIPVAEESAPEHVFLSREQIADKRKETTSSPSSTTTEVANSEEKTSCPGIPALPFQISTRAGANILIDDGPERHERWI